MSYSVVTLQFRVYAMYDKNRKLALLNGGIFILKMGAVIGVYAKGVAVGISRHLGPS